MHIATSQRILGLGLGLGLALGQQSGCKSEPDNKPPAPERQARTKPQPPPLANPNALADRSSRCQDLISDKFEFVGLQPSNPLNIVSDCTPSGCGGNSPIVNRFPVNGLHSDGCRNAQGYSLVPHSIKSPDSKSPCNGQTLTVGEDNRLTTTDPATCGPAALNNSQFTIEDEKTGKRQSITIHYSDMVTRFNHTAVLGYIFTASGDQRSLCDTAASIDFQKKLSDYGIEQDPLWKGLRKIDELALAAASELDASRRGTERTARIVTESGSGLSPEVTKANPADLAIVFLGEIRGENTETLRGSIGKGWFNIACTRDALAKLDIDRIEEHQSNPAPSPDYEKRRSAALKMVTAYYCPRPGQPGYSARYTYEGNEIEWERKSDKGKWEYHGEKHNPDIEAFWSSGGAVCLEHTRLYGKNLPSNIPRISLPGACQSGGCPDENSALQALRRVDCPNLNANPVCHRREDGSKADVFFISHSH